MSSLYYEDVVDGDEFCTQERSVREEDILLFGQLTDDNSQIHFSHEFASHTTFRRPIAHGMLGVSIFTGLAARLGLFETTSIALLAVRDWNFLAPLYPGDVVHGAFTVHPIRLTQTKHSGLVERRCRLLRSNDDLISEGSLLNLIKSRQFSHS